jgi:hypothetical protein
MRRPLASASAWIFVLRLRASGQQPASAPPFSARCRAVRFDVCGVDHLRVCGSSVPGKLPEQVFPDATPRPAYEAVIDRRRWTISFGAIARQPHLSTCTIPLITRRSSARSTPRTSFGKCGSIRAHCSSLSQNRFRLINSSPNTNQYRIVQTEKLMSSDPR